MSVVKYICKSSQCVNRNRGKNLILYRRANRRDYERKVKGKAMLTTRCPLCDARLPAGRLQKSVPKGGRDMSSRLFKRWAGGGSKRAARASLDRLRKAKRLELRLKNRGILRDEDMEDMEVSDDEDDPLFAPGGEFRPSMRFTRGTRRTLRATFNHKPHLKKVRARTRIGPGLMRNEGYTASTMGRAIHGSGSISAWQVAGRTRFSVDKFTSAEWCHLIADSLGGPTHSDNLVAASFAANTEMMAIEGLLKGKSRYEVSVIAYCTKRHVATMIRYQVHRKNAMWERWIDGENDHFTREDYSDLREELRDWLTSHK